MVFNKDQLLRKSSIEELGEGDKERLEKQFSEVELLIPKTHLRLQIQMKSLMVSVIQRLKINNMNLNRICKVTS